MSRQRIAAIAKRLGKRARVMLRVTSGIHAGGHEFVSTAHEDQKFGVALLPAGADAGKLGVLDDLTDVTPAGSNARLGEHASEVHAQRELQYDVKYPYDLSHEKVSEGDRRLADAMTMVADGPALAVLKDIYRRQDVLELVGVHSHIGSNIHDADAFIQAAKRMMLLRKTFYATDAYTLPEVDLGGGYSVAYTDGEDSMDIDVELGRLADAVSTVNRALGMPAPVISFEPGRWTVAPTGVTLYRVGTVKPVRADRRGEGQGRQSGDGTRVRVRGRRHVRQHPSGAVRLRLHRENRQSQGIRARPSCAASSACTANREISSSTRCGCPPTSSVATSSRCRSPAHTAARWPATTTRR